MDVRWKQIETDQDKHRKKKKSHIHFDLCTLIIEVVKGISALVIGGHTVVLRFQEKTDINTKSSLREKKSKIKAKDFFIITAKCIKYLIFFLKKKNRQKNRWKAGEKLQQQRKTYQIYRSQHDTNKGRRSNNNIARWSYQVSQFYE